MSLAGTGDAITEVEEQVNFNWERMPFVYLAATCTK